MDGKNGDYNMILYSYPGGDCDTIITSGVFRVGAERPEDMRPAARQAGKKAEGADMERSMRRARAKLRRLAMANDFEYFVTLTLDQTRIDRYDPKVITKALNQWTDNMVRRHGLRYVIVPELHKDGAFHFHGFFAGKGLKVVDSGHVDDCGQTVYNLPQWRYGFSTAIRLRGEYAAAVGYVCKYIGKQGGERPLGRWYYSGGPLKEPEKEYLEIDYAAWAAAEISMGPLPAGERWDTYPVETRIGTIWVQNNQNRRQKHDLQEQVVQNDG